MSRVITFSRYFPATHPKKGQPTFFVEQIWKGFIETNLQKGLWIDYISPYQNLFGKLPDFDSVGIKNHTIRGGNRWKVGDKFSPRVWSGKPYASKQIIIAPDIEIKKIWEVGIELTADEVGNEYYCWNLKSFTKPITSETLKTISLNDGLTEKDFDDWFPKKQTFTGQIICWNDSIEY